MVEMKAEGKEDQSMAHLFEESTLSGISMKNRIIRSATHEAMATENGGPRDELIRLYEKLAEGGVSCVITGLTAVQHKGLAFSGMLMMHQDELINAYKPLVQSMKERNTPLVMQLAHAGGKISPTSPNKVAAAPSRKTYPPWSVKARELTGSEIGQIIHDFVKAIGRTQQAGFDGVQIHAAHGYLLSQFLSPHFNQRTDGWGGSLENRFRIIGEIMKKARQIVDSYPIWIKISGHDGDLNGMRLPEAVRVAQMFEEAGGDAVEISCGGSNFFDFIRVREIPTDAILHYDPVFSQKGAFTKKILSRMLPSVIKKEAPLHLYNVEAAAAVKEAVTIPVISVGGFRKREDMEAVLQEGKADYISLSRPLVIEPALVNQLQTAKKTESACIDCGYCAAAVNAAPLHCYYGKIS